MNNLLKKHKDLVILLAIFMLVIVFMSIFAGTIAYFKNSKKVEGDIELAELDYTINVNNISQLLLLPGDDIEINVSIENKVEGKKDLVPFYFRFKILNEEEDYNMNNVNLFSGEDYIKDNNFYYYKYKLNYLESAKILNKITIDENLKKEEVESLNLSILIDAVQSEFSAYKEVFFDAPEEWVEFIENN